jgi:lysophospholipase L1-like esterase
MADLKATKRSPRVVVVATGSNDFANRGALTVAIARVAHASKVRGFRLVWVNVYRANLDPAPVNRIIARGGPRVHVADWFTLITHHLNPTTGRSPWLKDGVHVNAEGAQWRTNLLRRAIVG